MGSGTESLTDSVPVIWLRLRAELEQMEEEEALDEEDSINSSLLLLGCILLVKRRSLQKKRSKTSSGRGPRDVQDHMEQESHGSGSTDADSSERKVRGFSVFHVFNWAKKTN